MSAHAPIEDSGDNGKNIFYDQLSGICSRLPQYDMLMVLGDFNIKIGKDFPRGIAGRFTLLDEISENGSY